MKLLSSALAVTLAIAPGCSKKTNDAGGGSAATGSATTGSATTGSAATGSGSAPAGSATTATPDAAAADFISVFAVHAEPKPTDPVEVKFQKFTVTKAAFDPENLEGGTATLEIDLASLDSGSAKRDGHLKTPDYIDIAKFTTATVDIANVKKKDDTHYTADATVKLRGIEKTYPVEFEVLGTTDDSVKVSAAHKFARTDFDIGKDGPEQSVGAELEIKLRLTLKKT